MQHANLTESFDRTFPSSRATPIQRLLNTIIPSVSTPSEHDRHLVFAMQLLIDPVFARSCQAWKLQIETPLPVVRGPQCGALSFRPSNPNGSSSTARANHHLLASNTSREASSSQRSLIECFDHWHLCFSTHDDDDIVDIGSTHTIKQQYQ